MFQDMYFDRPSSYPHIYFGAGADNHLHCVTCVSCAEVVQWDSIDALRVYELFDIQRDYMPYNFHI